MTTKEHKPWPVRYSKKWAPWWNQLYEDGLWASVWLNFLETLDATSLFRWSAAVGPRNKQHNHRYAPTNTRVALDPGWWNAQCYRATYFMRYFCVATSKHLDKFPTVAADLGTKLTETEVLALDAAKAVAERSSRREAT